MKVIAFVMFLITLFTVAYSVPTNLSPQSVKTRNSSINLADTVRWDVQSAFYTTNLGQESDLKQFTTTNYGTTLEPNQRFLPVAASPSKKLCIRAYRSDPGYAFADPWSTNCNTGEFGFEGYQPSSLIWVYPVKSIDSLAYTLWAKIDNQDAILQNNLVTTKNDFEAKVDKAIATLQSGVFSKSLREQGVKELSEKLQPLVEAEVSKRVKLLQSDPEFIKNIALAVKKLKP